MITKLEELKAIAEQIDYENRDVEFMGLRVVNEDCDGYELPIDSDCPTSYVWEDGEWTEDEVEGTCCISVGWLHKHNCMPVVGYVGRRVWLIGGDFAEYGQDDGELIIKDAKILAVFDCSPP